MMIKQSFAHCTSNEEIYQTIMEWGKRLPPFKDAWKIDANLVSGCQSVMYLHAHLEDGKLYFAAASDALISAGLAALMIEAYRGYTPEALLTTPPTFLEEIGIPGTLTPGRANGLASLFLKMKQTALSYLLPTPSSPQPQQEKSP